MGDNLQLNIMKIKLFLSIISVICFFSLVGCAPKESNTNNSKETKKVEINMGAMPAPDSAPLYVAQRKGYFKDEGIDINLTLFKDALKRDAAVSSGKLDGTVTDLVMYTSYIKGNTGWKLGTSLPGVLSALRIALGTSFAILFFTEEYGTEIGLGYFIMDQWQRMNYPTMYAGIIIVSIIAYILFEVINISENYCTRWKK